MAKKPKDPKSAGLKKFLEFFPKGFYDAKYKAWERDYKWNAHLEFKEHLNEIAFRKLLDEGRHFEAAQHAIRIESRTNLLFSFEKMALRDAVKSVKGAELFAEGLYNLIYGTGDVRQRFLKWIEVVGKLPRIQTRVLTWPLATVFGFIADPKHFIFLKPRVTQTAAERYGFEFDYRSKPNWETYHSLLDFAHQVKKNHPKLKPRDYIDLQSFIWVLGSSEYE